MLMGAGKLTLLLGDNRLHVDTLATYLAQAQPAEHLAAQVGPHCLKHPALVLPNGAGDFVFLTVHKSIECQGPP
jgi:hypothetical protein